MRIHRLFSLLLALPLTACAGSASPQAPAKWAPAAVHNGIDVLHAGGFVGLAGRKVGLITNHTGLSVDGVSTAQLLHTAKAVKLVALFSPEHGFHGKGEGEIQDAVHEATGLRIHSLYTKSRAPNRANLKGIDTLVFDIQDIGCRFYTYISTMGEAMQVAAKEKLRFVVLDRPNPIGGVVFGGPMRDVDAASFVAWHNVPLRHGMTVGELARMFVAERRIEVQLEVIAMDGWRRAMFFDATGQTFVDPSPNMRSPTQALLYPGVGLLETTNLSVGRGTDTPFELIGAPWMNGRRLAAAIHAAKIPGLRCVPIRFTPTTSAHRDKLCHGIRFWIVDRAGFDPIRLGIELATALRHLHPKAWSMKRFDRLLTNREVFRMVEDGQTADTIMRAIAQKLRGFAKRRAPFLLYK
jgi:uncharacterized protein YbbC (DUF1343 family)